MADLLTVSRGLTEVVKAARPFIAQVRARSSVPSTGVVWSADGLIITTEHAVESDTGIEVTLPDGAGVTAELVGRDPRTDVAVLRVAGAKGLAVAPWSELEGTDVGSLVLILARPGRSVRATLGVVSALGEEWHSPRGGRLDHYLETDAEMRPGFSGGLLADAGGRALGIVSSALYRGRSIAIPTATLRRVVASLVDHGSVQRGYLGIGVHPVRLSGKSARADQDHALVVVSVQPDSPADRAGLLVGDVLLSFNGKPVRHVMELFELLDEERAGKPASAHLLRGGAEQRVDVTVGTRS